MKDLLRRISSNIIYPLWEARHPGDYISFRAFDYYKCIFIHIPKAAGTSVNKTLFGNIGAAHTKLTHFEKIYAPDTFRRYFKFTFVRNPYDRIFSAYNYLSKGGGNVNDNAFFKAHLINVTSFEMFIEDYLNDITLRAYIHLEPQVDFIRKTDGTIGMDFIGRYENIRDDFATISKRLNVNRELKKENPTSVKRLNYNDFFTKSMRDKVFSLYKDDFEILNYER
jgi:hypothetical protein